jgi:hypothetical protein
MAILYFVKYGPRPGNSGPGYKIDLTDLYKHLPNLNTSFLGIEPPTFNEKSTSTYPVRVVVEVLTDEVDSNKFQNADFHLLAGVAPDDANLSKVPKQLEMK